MASYIIKNNTLIAKLAEEIKSGTVVIFSNTKVKESINANREWNLASAKEGKISNAKKWDKAYAESDAGLAVKINEGEYLI